MKTYSPIFLLLFWLRIASAQNTPQEATQFFLELEGKWELVQASVQMEPSPPLLDTSALILHMICKIGEDSLSLHCSYNGSKNFGKDTIPSAGQELLVFEPNQAVVYKLGGIKNFSLNPSFNKSFVTVGKGVFLNDGSLKLTEFLAGVEGPTGEHIFLFQSPNLFKETARFYNEEGELLRFTEWDMKRVSESMDKK
ncbi:MAG: hypothetical protein AAFY71_12050 [Bacteroidota bacterium]